MPIGYKIRTLLDVVRRVYVAFRSRWYVFYYTHCYGVKFGKGVRIYSRFSVAGPGKITIGDGTTFKSRFIRCILITIKPDSEIRIGKNCMLNGTTIAAARSVAIEDGCVLSDANIMDTSSHGISPSRRRDSTAAKITPVLLHENVWIGSQAYIMPGVTIGKNTIVGVNSVVSKSLPENVFAAGAPAKTIRALKDDE